ncbi:hypothetical protein [Jeotgalicoccus sp. FSL K6-3177]|uniref:hypothetical protein n=1 Tax=Jeotgalicoccus sp. FSL K6-3177 TaxID=2921494 RepID=UPI0030FD681A
MLSYQEAIKKLEELSTFISLVDNYPIKSVEDLIIQQYAIYNSISKVIRHLTVTKNIHHSKITPLYIKSIILSKPTTQLHSMVRKEYLKKTRPQRRRTKISD